MVWIISWPTSVWQRLESEEHGPLATFGGSSLLLLPFSATAHMHSNCIRNVVSRPLSPSASPFSRSVRLHPFCHSDLILLCVRMAFPFPGSSFSLVCCTLAPILVDDGELRRGSKKKESALWLRPFRARHQMSIFEHVRCLFFERSIHLMGQTEASHPRFPSPLVERNSPNFRSNSYWCSKSWCCLTNFVVCSF